MSDLFQIDPTLEIPIYRQLVDRIRADIRTEQLPAGAQLPTVRELADRLGLARGTIKRAYDELEQSGLVEKVQGQEGPKVLLIRAYSSGAKAKGMDNLAGVILHELGARNIAD